MWVVGNHPDRGVDSGGGGNGGDGSAAVVMAVLEMAVWVNLKMNMVKVLMTRI